jgi:PAS domain S-box-containing protein
MLLNTGMPRFKQVSKKNNMDKINVLLVEDEQIMALDLREKLENMGFVVPAVVDSGENAFSMARKIRPDLVLMDILIKGDNDGIETAGKIRKNFNTPIIFLSALSDEVTMQRAKLSDPFAYLIKPFDDRELKFTIETAIHRHRLENQLSARLRYEEGLAKASQWLLADIDPMEAITRTLQYLLTASGVSRVYIFENFAAPTGSPIFRQVREVCAGGVDTQIDNPLLQRFFEEKRGKHILEILQAGDVFQTTAAELPPEAGEIFESRGVLSLLMLPIHVGGKFWGFIGFDDVRTTQVLGAEDVRLLRTAVDMISAYMERRQAEEKLRESERKYRELIEGLNEVVYRMSVPEGKPDYFSPAAQNVFGFDSDEFVKKPLFIKTIIHPDSLAYFEEIWAEISNGIVPPSCEYKITGGDKKERWIFQSNKGIFDSKGNITGLEGIFRDITERKILEEQLKNIAGEWFSTFDAINDPIALLDSQKQILRCNKATPKLVGKSFPDLLGRKICDLIHGSQVPEDCIFAQMQTSRQRESRIMHIAERWFKVSVDPIFDEKGALSGAVHIMNDISKQKKAEDKLRTQQVQLQQADKMISLGILVSGMAHEINNPNNSITLNTQFLQKAWQSIIPILDEYYTHNRSLSVAGIKYEKIRGKAPSLFSGILDSSKRIRHIVEDLKSFSRKNPVDIKIPVDINAVVKSAINLVNNIIKKSTHNFKITLGKKLPKIKGNFQGLEQVVINLVQNACLALAAPDKEISVSTFYDPASGRLIVGVEDEGVGIPGADLKYITEPFFTTRRTSGGTGLGLSVSARIIAEHNAELHFTSTPGKGTCVKVSFPVTEGKIGKKRRKDD